MIIESRIYYLRVLLSKIAKNMYFSVPIIVHTVIKTHTKNKRI